DLKWQLALLSMRTRRFFQKTGKKITINGSDTARYNKSKVECFNCHKLGYFARECRQPKNQDRGNENQDSSRRTVNVEDTSSNLMVAIDGAGFDWSFMADDEVLTNMALMAFSDSEIIRSQIPDNSSKGVGFVSYNAIPPPPTRPNTSKSASEDIPNDVKESPNALLVKELVSDDKLEKKIIFPTVVRIEFVRPKQQEKLVRKLVKYAKMYRLTAITIKGKGWYLGIIIQSSRRTVNVEETASKAMVAIDGDGFDWSYMEDDEVPTNMALMDFSESKPEFEGYGPKTSNSVSEDMSNKVKESPDAPLVKELVSGDKLEKKIMFLTVAKIEFGNPKLKLQEKGVIDSGCSRHMTGNMSYLSEYEEIDSGYVEFRRDPNGGKITGKGKISTDTECVVLSLDFKLLDESQILLRVLRKNNMYSVDLKNVAPSGGLTCLFTKDTLDESNLWHRRLWRINFKTMNKLESNIKPLVRPNLVLVIKPYNKTPCELFNGRTPSLSFMRPFGCPVRILNTLDPLGKFDGMADEGFFVGYSVNSKAFIVFNSRTMIVKDTLHIAFLGNKPNVARSRPTWLFDIDTLTKSMNYKPDVAGNQSNDSAGFSWCWLQTIREEEKKDAEGPGNIDSEVPNTEDLRINQEMDANVNSTNNINVVNVSDIKDNAVDNCEEFFSPSRISFTNNINMQWNIKNSMLFNNVLLLNT
nr:ribonuclease H-like domain-containing protein [Tanacetum cinerariifolium]